MSRHDIPLYPLTIPYIPVSPHYVCGWGAGGLRSSQDFSLILRLFPPCLSKSPLLCPAEGTLLSGCGLAPAHLLLVTFVNSVMVYEYYFLILISVLVLALPSN